MYVNVFFFSSRRRHTRCYRDWSSDVCSSDLLDVKAQPGDAEGQGQEQEQPPPGAGEFHRAKIQKKGRAFARPIHKRTMRSELTRVAALATNTSEPMRRRRQTPAV